MSEQRTRYRTTRPGPRPEFKTSNLLAIALYLAGDITEGRLAGSLRMDRLEARSRVKAFLDQAIENASVPIERISTLETRVATLTAQIARADLEREDMQGRLAGAQLTIHDLRSEAQRYLFQIDELRQDLAAERQHVIELTRLAQYARRLADLIVAEITDPETGEKLSAAELYRLADQALGSKEF